MNDSGSESVPHAYSCSLLENCRHWSERKELDTFRHDLIFCCTTAEPEQDDQLE